MFLSMQNTAGKQVAENREGLSFQQTRDLPLKKLHDFDRWQKPTFATRCKYLRVLSHHHLALSRFGRGRNVSRIKWCVLCIQAQKCFRTGDYVVFQFPCWQNLTLSSAGLFVEPLQRSSKGYQAMSTYFRFLFFVLSIPSAVALLIPQASTNSSLAMFKNHCTLRRSLASNVPDYDDCLRAINRLPTRPLHENGPFHNGPPEDPYQLPVTKDHGSCKARVELRAGGAVFKESWPGVKGAAWLLNKECLMSLSRVTQLYDGGWTTWGNHERIVINLAYSDELGEVGVSNNITTVW